MRTSIASIEKKFIRDLIAGYYNDVIEDNITCCDHNPLRKFAEEMFYEGVEAFDYMLRSDMDDYCANCEHDDCPECNKVIGILEHPAYSSNEKLNRIYELFGVRYLQVIGE